MLEGGGLCEVEDNVPAEESGIDVLAGALEGEDIGADEDLQGRLLVLVLDGHVVVGGGEGMGGDVLVIEVRRRRARRSEV